jgi:hypothetical protein
LPIGNNGVHAHQGQRNVRAGRVITDAGHDRTHISDAPNRSIPRPTEEPHNMFTMDSPAHLSQLQLSQTIGLRTTT